MNYRIRADDLRPLSLGETDPVLSVIQNIAIILNTRQGTCPFFRDFGLRQDYLHRPINVVKAMLISEIHEAIAIFEPRANVLKISFEAEDEKPDRLVPVVEVEINA